MTRSTSTNIVFAADALLQFTFSDDGNIILTEISADSGFQELFILACSSYCVIGAKADKNFDF